jgi:hypothetical protein
MKTSVAELLRQEITPEKFEAALKLFDGEFVLTEKP